MKIFQHKNGNFVAFEEVEKCDPEVNPLDDEITVCTLEIEEDDVKETAELLSELSEVKKDNKNLVGTVVFHNQKNNTYSVSQRGHANGIIYVDPSKRWVKQWLDLDGGPKDLGKIFGQFDRECKWYSNWLNGKVVDKVDYTEEGEFDGSHLCWDPDAENSYYLNNPEYRYLGEFKDFESCFHDL